MGFPVEFSIGAGVRRN